MFEIDSDLEKVVEQALLDLHPNITDIRKDLKEAVKEVRHAMAVEVALKTKLKMIQITKRLRITLTGDAVYLAGGAATVHGGRLPLRIKKQSRSSAGNKYKKGRIEAITPLLHTPIPRGLLFNPKGKILKGQWRRLYRPTKGKDKPITSVNLSYKITNAFIDPGKPISKNILNRIAKKIINGDYSNA